MKELFIEFSPHKNYPFLITLLEGNYYHHVFIHTKIEAQTYPRSSQSVCSFCFSTLSTLCSLFLYVNRERVQALFIYPYHKRLRVPRRPGDQKIHFQRLKAGRKNQCLPKPRRKGHPMKNIVVKQVVFQRKLTGHHTILRPARKKPPTVPRLVENIA